MGTDRQTEPRRARRRGARRNRSGDGGGAAARRRLSPHDRRRELLRAAAALMTARGVDGVQFADVATAAGVTRPLVYRFFPSRRALIMAVLEDYADDLTARFARGALRGTGSLDEVARVFVEATCDTIADKGAGPWHLLDSKGPDPEVARLGQEILDRLMAPWQTRIAHRLAMDDREAATVARMVVAAGRAVLELWYGGVLTREEAVRDTARGVSALLRAFGGARRDSEARRRRRRRSPQRTAATPGRSSPSAGPLPRRTSHPG
jgi:AcrR family transcriptional regulator